MSKVNINRVLFSGNLTADPELRALPSGRSVCSLRVANNTRRKDATTGEWADKPNYFTVNVFGPTAENVARYLSKGSGVLIDGRLDWREWEAEGGAKRQAVEINGESVEFLPDGKDRSKDSEQPDAEQVPAGVAAAGGGDDDIPF